MIVKCSSKRFQEVTGDLHRRAGCNVQERCLKIGERRSLSHSKIKSQSIKHSQSLSGANSHCRNCRLIQKNPRILLKKSSYKHSRRHRTRQCTKENSLLEQRTQALLSSTARIREQDQKKRTKVKEGNPIG